MNTIFTDGMRFVDEFGRERIFHGINVCDKGRKVGGTGMREYDCEWDEALFEQFRNCGFQPDTDWYYHCEFILDTFDKYHWSDTYRAYFDGLFDYQLHEKVLKRPYPRAVAGRIIEYRHDRSEGSFSLSFEQDKSCKAPTEIYAHKAVRAVESDLKYTVTEADGGYIVAFKDGKNGIHDIKITFCE